MSSGLHGGSSGSGNGWSASGEVGTEWSVVDPQQFQNWDTLVAEHPGTSCFHGTCWARVLQETYGHKPRYFCRIDNGHLAAVLPLMELRSRWRGCRGVSLPFTDFCNALHHHKEESLYRRALEYGRQHGWRFLQCRSNNADWIGARPSLTFYGHMIDLRLGAEALFRRFKPSVRRCIRRAESTGLTVDFDHSPKAMQTFYELHCVTRRRHGTLPQPWRFFENIAGYVVGSGHGQIVTARVKNQPIASAVFFQFGKEALLKFAASDYSFQRLRPNDEILWAAINRFATQGIEWLHLGRTSLGNEGLRRFKLGFAAQEETISYYKFDFRKNSFVTEVDLTENWVRHVFRRLPLRMASLVGNILYPHYS